MRILTCLISSLVLPISCSFLLTESVNNQISLLCTFSQLERGRTCTGCEHPQRRFERLRRPNQDSVEFFRRSTDLKKHCLRNSAGTVFWAMKETSETVRLGVFKKSISHKRSAKDMAGYQRWFLHRQSPGRALLTFHKTFSMML